MALTPETLPRHELVGLHAEVREASDPGLVGIAGEVVGETMKTLRIAGADRVRQVPKTVATVAFELPDGQRAVVEGERLVARPVRRTEQTGDSIWR